LTIFDGIWGFAGFPRPAAGTFKPSAAPLNIFCQKKWQRMVSKEDKRMIELSA